MFETNMLQILQSQRTSVQAQLFEIDRKRQEGLDKLRELNGAIAGIEQVVKNQADEAPKVAAQREADIAAAIERGKIEAAASAAAPTPPARKARRSV